jgi:hypothetical protein
MESAVVTRSRIMSRALAIALASAALTSVLPAPASAQGFFDFLFGRRSAPPAASSYADPNPQFNPYGAPREERRVETAPAGSYCVRLCDGRFFPIQRTSGSNPAQTCSSFCPAAQTKVFNGSGIDHSVANDGARYADLSNAFAYRERVVADCTCNGRDSYGLVTGNAEDDPTLRPGDIVATNDGFVAYNGNGSGRRRNAEFTPIGSYRGLSAEMRERLAGTKIAPRNASVVQPPTNAAQGADRRVQLDR